jgi:hypothetical protein
MCSAVVAQLVLSVALAAPGGSALQRLKSWVGEAKAVAAVAGYDATADCTGPRGPYRTRIAVRRSDAWTRFTQWKDGALGHALDSSRRRRTAASAPDQKFASTPCEASVRLQKRLMLARISPADFVQR